MESLWYQYDHIGNIIAKTNKQGQVVEVVNMEAFGKVKQGNQVGIHLTTKEYDPDSELYYFNQRWYEPSIGIFIERAPRPLLQEHPYSAFKQDPLHVIDPHGTCPEYDCGCADQYKKCLQREMTNAAKLGIACVPGCAVAAATGKVGYETCLGKCEMLVTTALAPALGLCYLEFMSCKAGCSAGKLPYRPPLDHKYDYLYFI